MNLDHYLVDVSDIFYFFLLLGEGEKGESGALGAGVGSVFIENQEGGGGFQEGEGPRGREGGIGEFFWGGGG